MFLYMRLNNENVINILIKYLNIHIINKELIFLNLRRNGSQKLNSQNKNERINKLISFHFFINEQERK